MWCQCRPRTGGVRRKERRRERRKMSSRSRIRDDELSLLQNAEFKEAFDEFDQVTLRKTSCD